MLVNCPSCKASYHIEPPLLPPSGKVRCKPCGRVWLVKPETDKRAERGLVNAALDQLKKQTNGWEIIKSVPLFGPIGFALEAALYDYLAHPAAGHVPDGAAGLCVFHKDFRPRERTAIHGRLGRKSTTRTKTAMTEICSCNAPKI